MRAFTVFLTLLASPGPLMADTQAELNALLQRLKDSEKNIPAIVKQYAESIGCGFWMDPANVVRHTVDGEGGFVALFHVDSGCSGGSRSSRTVFALLQSGAWDRYYINITYSSPGQTSREFMPTVSRIYVENGRLMFHDRGDPRFLRPVSYGQVDFRDGQWIKVDPVVLPMDTAP